MKTKTFTLKIIYAILIYETVYVFFHATLKFFSV